MRFELKESKEGNKLWYFILKSGDGIEIASSKEYPKSKRVTRQIIKSMMLGVNKAVIVLGK